MTAQPELDFSGPALRDRGISKVLANNEEWKQRFFTAAAMIVQARGTVTSDLVVEAIGEPDGSPNVIGAAMRSFAVSNKLQVVHYMKSQKPKRHAAIVAVWGRTA